MHPMVSVSVLNHERKFEATLPACKWLDECKEVQQLSYAELATKTNQVCRVLQQHARPAVGTEETLKPIVAALYMGKKTHPDMVPVLLGITKSGSACIVLLASWAEQRIKSILEMCTSCQHVFAVAAEKGVCDHVLGAGSQRQVSFVNESFWQKVPTEAVPAQPGKVCAIVHTSGSTGRPKGVIITHENIRRVVEDGRLLPEDERKSLVMLQQSALSFDVFMFELHAAIYHGGTLALTTDHADLMDTKDLISKCAVTHCCITARLFDCIVDDMPDVLASESLRRIYLVGEAVSLTHVKRARENYTHFALVNAYGPAENGVYSTIVDIATWADCHPDCGDNTIGQPVERTTCYVLPRGCEPTHAQVRQCEIDEEGELWVGGDGVSPGYYGSETATQERFRPDPFSGGNGILYRTGDLVIKRSDGNLVFRGRADRQIKLRGHRIEKDGVEMLMCKDAGVRQCCVVLNNEQLVACYVGELAAGEDGAKQALLRSLDAASVPTRFVKLPNFPLTPNGKTDEGKLQAELRRRTLSAKVLAFLRSELSENFEEDMGIREFGVFSLKAVKLQMKLTKSLSLSKTLEASVLKSVAEIVNWIMENDADLGNGQLPDVPARENDDVCPASCEQENLLTEWLIADEAMKTKQNEFILIRFTGQLDADILQKACQGLTDRHGTFRTFFEQQVTGGEIRQRIIEVGKSRVLFEHEQLPADEAERMEEFKRQWQQSFDFWSSPPLRFVLFSSCTESHLLILGHHILWDGFSLPVITEDLGRLYCALWNGSQPSLKSLSGTYAQFSQRQRDRVRSQATELQQYWERATEHHAEWKPLRHCSDCPKVQAPLCGEMQTFELDKKYLDKLEKVGKSSPFKIIMAAFYILLRNETTADYQVTGMTYANRRDEEYYQTVGFLVSVLPIHVHVDGDASFMDVLRALEDRVQGSTEHVLPLKNIYASLPPTSTRNGAYQVLVNLKAIDFDPLPVKETGCEAHVLGYGYTMGGNMTAKEDLILQIEYGRFSFEWNQQRFTAARVKSMGELLRSILKQVAEDPNLAVSMLDYSRPVESAIQAERGTNAAAQTAKQAMRSLLASKDKPSSSEVGMPNAATALGASPATAVRKRPILIVGGGVAGVMTATECRKQNLPFLLVEKEERLGGVWFNGCNKTSRLQTPKEYYRIDQAEPWKCDTDFPDRQQVLEHIDAVAQNGGIMPFIRFNTEVVKVNSDDEACLSVHLRVSGQPDELVEVQGIVVATGKHSANPFVPEHSPAAKIVHASKLDDVDLKGKRVVVIGGASFAVEAVNTAHAAGASKIHWITRRVHWVLPTEMMKDLAQLVNEDLDLASDHSAKTEKLRKALCRHYLSKNLQIAIPAPDEQFSIKVSLSDQFFEIAGAPPVAFIRGSVDEIKANSVVVDNEQIPADLIIAATGYDAPNFSFLQPLARGGEPRVYKGICLEDDARITFAGFADMRVSHPKTLQPNIDLALRFITDPATRPAPKDMAAELDSMEPSSVREVKCHVEWHTEMLRALKRKSNASDCLVKLTDHSRGYSEPARVAVVVFPHAGGTAEDVRDFANEADEVADVFAVEYAGRGHRQQEDFETSITDIAKKFVDSGNLESITRGRQTTVFVGQSMGARVALEVIRELQEQKRLPPCGLLVLSHGATLQLPFEDAASLCDDDLVQKLHDLTGDSRLCRLAPWSRATVLQLLRADVQACTRQSETCRPLPPGLPVTIFHGQSDPMVNSMNMEAEQMHWNSMVSDGNVTIERKDCGHFMLDSHRELDLWSAVRSLAVASLPTVEEKAEAILSHCTAHRTLCKLVRKSWLCGEPGEQKLLKYRFRSEICMDAEAALRQMVIVHEPEDQKSSCRWMYSPTTPPGSYFFEFVATERESADGKVTGPLGQIAIGEELQMTWPWPPTLPRDRRAGGAHVALLAFGTGVVHLLRVIEAELKEALVEKVVLLHSAKTLEESESCLSHALDDVEESHRSKFTLVRTITQAEVKQVADSRNFNRRVDEPMLREVFPWSDFRYMVSYPPGYCGDARRIAEGMLEKLGGRSLIRASHDLDPLVMG
ncbi:tycC [Symbiodinium sp. CCMP2592]|nr:tycC [Symbiodinium sp. CCMP2592]